MELLIACSKKKNILEKLKISAMFVYNQRREYLYVRCMLKIDIHY